VLATLCDDQLPPGGIIAARQACRPCRCRERAARSSVDVAHGADRDIRVDNTGRQAVIATSYAGRVLGAQKPQVPIRHV